MSAPRAVLVIVAASACAEPAVQMTLQLPSDTGFDVSCVDSVEIRVAGEDRGTLPTGPNDPGTPADDESDCIDITRQTTFARVRSQIAGQVDIDIPDSGLFAVEIRGSTGSCDAKKTSPGDAIFFGGAEYEGGDLVIPVEPNQSCAGKTDGVVVRPVDLLELVTKGTAACTTVVPDASGYGIGTGTLHDSSILGTIFDPNDSGRAVTGGVSTLSVYSTTGPDSCIALGYGNGAPVDVMSTAGCIRRGIGICTTGAQVEMPVINGEIASSSVDPAKVDDFGGFVVGAVWGIDAAGTRTPLTGATVKPKDPSAGTVVYANYTAGAASIKSLPTAVATDGSGMFITYVGTPTDFVVSAPNYKDETVRLGSPLAPSASLVVLRP
jgi:hypothetical protein